MQNIHICASNKSFFHTVGSESFLISISCLFLLSAMEHSLLKKKNKKKEPKKRTKRRSRRSVYEMEIQCDFMLNNLPVITYSGAA